MSDLPLFGCGPHGEPLQGRAYLISLLQHALNIRKGEVPLAPELGSDIHLSHGELINNQFIADLRRRVLDVVRQIDPNNKLKLQKISIKVDPAKFSAETVLLFLRSDIGAISLTDLKIGGAELPRQPISVQQTTSWPTRDEVSNLLDGGSF